MKKKTIHMLLLSSLLSSTLLYAPNQVQASEAIIHNVASGDTLWIIANRYHTTVSALKETNHLTSDMIYVGQTLQIPNSSPTGETHIVVSGDTLWKISVQYGVSVQQIISSNQLTSDVIYPGQKLTIGASSVDTIDIINYQVKQGDTIWNLSVQYGIPQTELLNVNGLNTSSSLTVGQTVKIPVHHIATMKTPGAQFGEYLDWWSQAQYVLPIGKTATVRDYVTGKTLTIKRVIGANHADCEPVTTSDTEIGKQIWEGFSWTPRAVIVEIDGRKIAASMSFMPHSIDTIGDNGFTGHFDLHFKNSTRHVDGLVDQSHQEQVKIAAGIQ